MERSPGTPAEAHHDGTSDKKKKRVEHAAILRVPLLVEQEKQRQKPAERPKATPLEAALANLAAKEAATKAEPAAAERSTKAKPTAPEQAEVANTEPPKATAPEKADNANPVEKIESDKKIQSVHESKDAELDAPVSEQEEDDSTSRIAAETDEAMLPDELAREAEEVYELLPSQELQSVDLSGGEVVIHLQGDEPVSERVVSASSLPETATSAELTTAETLTPLYTVQSESRPTPTQPQEQALSPEQPVVEVLEPEQLPLAEAVPTSSENTPAFGMPAQQAEIPQSSAMPRVEILPPQWSEIYGTQPAGPNAVPVNRAEQPATKGDVEAMAYRAERAGRNRGLVTGLLVGGGYEHFKHKRRERRQEKRLQSQTKQLEAARQHYQAGLQEQAQRQVESTRQQEFATQRVNRVEQRFEAQQRAEKPKPPEQIAVQPAEQLEIPPEHRLETSAWHSIEVDSRTGKPVENPTFQYGQEYYRERAQEQAAAAQQQSDEAAKTPKGAPGGVATAAAAPVADDHASLPPVYIPSATTQRPAGPTAQDTAKKRPKSADDGANPKPLWPWVVALVAVVISLVFVLR